MTAPRPAPAAGSIPTSVVGSHARPSWLESGLAAAARGEFGPVDLREMLDDAVDTAIRDQLDAGVDVITDGEMRRAGFFTAEFYARVTGVRALTSDRRLGAGGHDQQHRFEVLEQIDAPNGLGVVDEYRFARTRTDQPLKMTLPGPFTLSGRLQTGTVYPTRLSAAEAFVPILNRELRSLVEAGATNLQIDEPSPAIHPEAQADFAGLVNASLEGVSGSAGVRVSAHLCFGNYVGRPLAKRTYRPILDAMLAFAVDELVLEYANREMAELDVLEAVSGQRDVAVGVVDVKSYYLETADDVAERLELVLRHVPAERLTAVPDCGFSQTARWATKSKLRALVEGARLAGGASK